MFKYFNRLDAFGKSIDLKLNSKSKHTTNFGAFLTVCIVLTIVVAFCFYSLQLINKQDPNIIYSEKFIGNESGLKIDLLEKNFKLFLQLNDRNTHKPIPKELL